MSQGCENGAGRGLTPDAASAHETLQLVTDDWTILKMATAHGAFTVEVEVRKGIDTTALAEALIEPLQGQYAEILVYFHDRAADEDLPMLRIQWTASDGYTSTVY